MTGALLVSPPPLQRLADLQPTARLRRRGAHTGPSVWRAQASSLSATIVFTGGGNLLTSALALEAYSDAPVDPPIGGTDTGETGETELSSIPGTLRDLIRAPIANIDVVGEDEIATTDEIGQFRLTDVEPGEHVVMVVAY